MVKKLQLRFSSPLVLFVHLPIYKLLFILLLGLLPGKIFAATVISASTSSATSVCSGSNTTRTLTLNACIVVGLGTGTVSNIQWQESNDNGSSDAWANAVGGSGATTTTYTTPNLSTSIYYRCKFTYASGTACTSGSQLASATYYVNSTGQSTSSATTGDLVTVTPAASTPTASAASSITCTSFSANWSTGANATSYILDVSTSSGFGSFVTGFNALNVGNVTTKSVTGLSPNTTYYFRVRATNCSGTSGNSSTITAVTVTASDAGCYCSVTGAGATYYLTNVTFAGINNSTGASGYTFYSSPTASVNAGCTYAISLTENSFADYYRVWIDYNQDGTFASGESVFNGTFASPSATPATGTITIPAISASVLVGTTRMRVIHDYSAVAAGAACSNPSSYGEVEDYLVVVNAAAGAPATVTASAATGATCNSLVANWSSVTDATDYLLQVSTSSGFGTFVYNATIGSSATSKNVTGLSASTTYYYRVKAVNCSGTQSASFSSTITAATTGACYCSVTGPGTYYLTNVTFAGINNSTGNTNYTFYSSTPATVNTGCAYAISLTENSFGDWYGVWIDYNQDGAFSDAESVFNGRFPTSGSPATATGSITISGSASTGTTRMRVMHSGSGAIAVTDDCTNPPSWGEVEDYLVTISAGGSAPSAPTSSAASIVSCNSFSANWAAVAGVTSYLIDVATDASFTSILSSYNNLDVGNVITYSIAGLTSGTTYYYRVRASGCGGTSSSSGSQNATPTTGSTNTYVGAATGNWNVAGNWSLGIPSACHNVVIGSGKTVRIPTGVTAICNNVDNSGSLLLELHNDLTGSDPSNYLNIYGNLTNNSTGVIKAYPTYGGGAGVAISFVNRYVLTVYGTTSNAGQIGDVNTNNENLDGFDFKSDVTNTSTGVIHTDGMNALNFTGDNIFRTNLTNNGTIEHDLSNAAYSNTVWGNLVNNGTFNFTAASGATIGSANASDFIIWGSLTNNGTINHTSNAGVFRLEGTSKSMYTGASGNYSLNTKVTITNGASYTVYDSPILYETTINSTGSLTLASSGGVSMVTLSTYELNQNGTITFNDGRLEIEEASPTLTNANFNENTGTICYCSGKNYTGVTQSLPGSTFNFNSVDIGTASVATTLNASANTYNLSGNWTNYGTFSSSTSTINLNGSTAQTIGGTSSTAFYHLSVNQSAGGSTVLNINTTVGNGGTTGCLTLATANEFNLNSKTLIIDNPAAAGITRTAGYIKSETNAAVNPSIIQWKMGTNTSTHVYPFGINSSTYIPFSFTKTSTSANISVSTRATAGTDNAPWAGVSSVAAVANMNRKGADSSVTSVIDRWWDITSSVNPLTGGATMIFSYAGSENTVNAAFATGTISAQHWNGTTWDLPVGSGTGVTTGIGTVTVTGATTFSPWILSALLHPLPIQLLDLSGKNVNGLNTLAWKTASEINNSNFRIKRAIDGFSYETIGTVLGAGMSNVLKSYKFIDRNSPKGTTYYQLEQIDYNGTSEIMGTIVLENSIQKINDFSVGKNTSGEVITNFTSSQNEKYELELYEITGKKVFSCSGETIEGNNRVKMENLNVKPGFYLVTLRMSSTIFNKKIAL